jgi:hypothetical protein
MHALRDQFAVVREGKLQGGKEATERRVGDNARFKANKKELRDVKAKMEE